MQPPMAPTAAVVTLKQELLKHEGQPPSSQCRKAASASRHQGSLEVVLGLLLGTGGHIDRHRGKERQHGTRSTSSKLPNVAKDSGPVALCEWKHMKTTAT